MSEIHNDNDLEKLLQQWESERNMFDKFLDRLFPSGIANYRAAYALSHPWKIFDYVGREIKYAYQRIFRHWDDTVIFSIDYYLCEMMPVWLRKLKENKGGIPIDMFDTEDWDNEKCEYKAGSEKIAQEKFDNILEQIAQGFEAHKKIQDESLWTNDPEYKELNDKFETGMDLLKKHFGSLWD